MIENLQEFFETMPSFHFHMSISTSTLHRNIEASSFILVRILLISLEADPIRVVKILSKHFGDPYETIFVSQVSVACSGTQT